MAKGASSKGSSGGKKPAPTGNTVTKNDNGGGSAGPAPTGNKGTLLKEVTKKGKITKI